MRIAEDRSAEPMTVEQWADLPEDEPGELVDGRLIEEEMPSFIHEFVVVTLAAWLREWTGRNGGYVLGSEWKLAVAKHRGRKGDLAIYLPGSAIPTGRAKFARTPPDVVVEVVTSTPRDARRDRVEKLDEYAAFGVAWYWIVDPELRSLEVFENIGGRYSRALGATDGSAVAIPGFAGLVVDLDALWREVERLAVDDEGPS